MRRRQFCRVFGCTMAWGVLPGSITTAAADSIEDIGYWRRFSQELTPAHDPRAAKAHAIFDRLVEVADKRRDVKLQLWITASDPWQIGLPIAIRDGWIVLSKGVLEMCYREPTWGEDRLAFVMAHEMAHQLHDDLWHVRFAQAFEAQRLQDPALPQILEQLPRTTREVERVRERELRADESGMRYAALAGFNPHAIITQNPSENFFAEWVRVLEPRFPGIGSVPPTPQERAEHLRAHLQRVANATSMFTVGLWSYYSGNYPQAIRAFEAFRSVFASREVLHNLAASYHQLALQAYEKWQLKPQTFPFQLSLLIEPLTRASRIYLERTRGPGAEPEVVFHQCLSEAIKGYGEALTQESYFTPALLNIGAA
jgi:hypothetical protein